MNDNSDYFQRGSAFRKLDMQSTDFTSADSQIGVTNEMMQVINSQNMLIMKLLQRQSLLYQELNKKLASSDSGSRSNDKNQNLKLSGHGSNGSNQLQQFSSSSNRSGDQKPLPNSCKIAEKKQNNFVTFPNPKGHNFKSQVNSSPQQEGVQMSDLKQEKSHQRKRQTETKNMIKNFAKAIFSFIRKNRDKKLQILGFLEISQEDFMKVHDSLKGRIHSISELRSLWTIDGNDYHRAFRMLSCEYLRKHCLERTFNSRVENYSVHLKYRQRLLDGLKNPEEFTALKIN